MFFDYFFQSKLLMFEAWYKKITGVPGLKFDLGMTDTDSFLFKVNDKKLLLDRCNSIMDYSNYPQDHHLYSQANKAKLGFFKDELCGKFVCQEFVGLRSKCYAMKLKDITTSELSDKKVCKGVGRTAIKNRIKFDHYKQCLFESTVLRQSYHSIRSEKHNLKTVLINKKALSFVDTKRWLFNCGIHSAPYGSYLIKQYRNACPFCK